MLAGANNNDRNDKDDHDVGAPTQSSEGGSRQNLIGIENLNVNEKCENFDDDDDINEDGNGDDDYDRLAIFASAEGQVLQHS